MKFTSSSVSGSTRNLGVDIKTTLIAREINNKIREIWKILLREYRSKKENVSELVGLKVGPPVGAGDGINVELAVGTVVLGKYVGLIVGLDVGMLKQLLIPSPANLMFPKIIGELHITLAEVSYTTKLPLFSITR